MFFMSGYQCSLAVQNRTAAKPDRYQTGPLIDRTAAKPDR